MNHLAMFFIAGFMILGVVIMFYAFYMRNTKKNCPPGTVPVRYKISIPDNKWEKQTIAVQIYYNNILWNREISPSIGGDYRLPTPVSSYPKNFFIWIRSDSGYWIGREADLANTNGRVRLIRGVDIKMKFELGNLSPQEYHVSWECDTLPEMEETITSNCKPGNNELLLRQLPPGLLLIKVLFKNLPEKSNSGENTVLFMKWLNAKNQFEADVVVEKDVLSVLRDGVKKKISFLTVEKNKLSSCEFEKRMDDCFEEWGVWESSN